MSILSSFFESVSADVAIASLLILFGLVYGSFRSSTALAPKKYISQIIVHPIKSCRGTSVSEARYTPQGLENDRKFVIVDANTHVTITAREIPRMVLIHPIVHEDPNGGHLSVSFPEKSDCPTFQVPLFPSAEILSKWELIPNVKIWSNVTDGYICPQLNGDGPSPSTVLSKYLDRAVHLILKGPTTRALQPTSQFPALEGSAVFQDGYPLLVTSLESLADVQAKITATALGKTDWEIKGVDERWKQGEITMERFRPNLVVEGCNKPFEEDTWEDITIGDEKTGGGQVSCVSKCGRCQLPNIEPTTGIQDPAVPYKVIAKFRRVDPNNKYDPCFGVNAVPSSSGVFRVGDEVEVVKLLPQ